MASKQTRRSISVRGTTYDSLRGWCEDNGKSMSEVVEELLAKLLGGAAPTEKTAAPAKAGKAERPRVIAAPARERPRMANKVVRAQAEPARVIPSPLSPATRGQQTGRPAPKTAREVIGERPRAPKGDYRDIQF